MKAFKVILAVLVIFGAGFACGLIFSQSRPGSEAVVLPDPAEGGIRGTNSVPPWERGRRSFIGRLQRDLSLTDEQRDRMDTIFQESRQRTHELWERLKEPMAEEVRFVAEQVKTVLTSEQQEQYDKMMKARFRRPSFNDGEAGESKQQPDETATEAEPAGR